MEARNRVISTAHLTACSIKKHVKAPDLTCMPLYGNVLSNMEARNRVISTAHLTACSVKKHVKAPDLTCMPLYGNVLSNIKIAWTAKQHWVLTKHRGPSLHTMTSPLLYYKREKQRIRVGLTYNATTGRPPSVSGGRCWLKSEQRSFVIYRRNTYEQYGGYNLFQNAEFKANFSIKVWGKC